MTEVEKQGPADEEGEPGRTADETEASPAEGEPEQSLSEDEWAQASAAEDEEPSLSADAEQQGPAAGELGQDPAAESETAGEPTASPWPWGVLLPVVVAFVLALLWGLHSSRRFRRVKDAVEALNPHLLGVNIDHNIVITEVTDALCRATGFKNRDLVGKPLMALGSPADEPGAMHDMWSRIKRGMAWKGEVKLVRKNGSVMWADAVISPLRRKSEKASGYTVFYQDISKRKHFENLSMRDELTGLFNRRYFNEVSPSLWVKARREQQLFGLCILDVDNFKLYNDTYGHPAGDQVLTALGTALTSVFQRRDDMVFRLGGEEFGAIFIVNDREEAVALANRALQEIRHLRIEHQQNPPGIVTASMGLKLVDANNADEMETLYKQADQALYEAKQSGRDRFMVAPS